MALVTYTFTLDTETKQAVKSGNISTQQALHLLTDIMIAEKGAGPKTVPGLKTEEKTI